MTRIYKYVLLILLTIVSSCSIIIELHSPDCYIDSISSLYDKENPYSIKQGQEMYIKIMAYYERDVTIIIDDEIVKTFKEQDIYEYYWKTNDYDLGMHSLVVEAQGSELRKEVALREYSIEIIWPGPSMNFNIFQSIDNSSIKCEAVITQDDGKDVTSKGFCLSTTPNPTINNVITDQGPGGGGFECIFSNLESNTIYYGRAYSINANGISYSDEMKTKTD